MWFFLFVMCVAINCSFTIYFACYCMAIEGIQLLYVLGVLEALVFCGLGWILTCTSVNIKYNYNYMSASKSNPDLSKFTMICVFCIGIACVYEFDHK